jgi:hypothetical protein
MGARLWPSLELAAWEPTYLTLHRWTQMVGKMAVLHAPYVNHWWHVALHLTSRGLTATMPSGDGRHLTMTFDFCSHRFEAHTSDKQTRSFPLEPMTVAAFYERLVRALAELGVPSTFRPVPVEVADTTPFPQDLHHAAYDAKQVEALHRILLEVERVFEVYRGRFVGKSSPVHFFWGAFDLAVTRFSGRPNPSPPPGSVMRDAYSHEVISHGFWPGGDWLDRGRIDEAVFYAYAIPEPAGFRSAAIAPAPARYAEPLGEWLLPYDAVRRAADPEATLLDFMERTYRAAATLGGWDVSALERPVRRAQAESYDRWSKSM